MFLEEFADYMDGHATTSGQLLVVGDFNIHYDNTINSSAKKFRELHLSMNLAQWIEDATHEKGHILDLIITRQDENCLVKNISIQPFYLLDHNIISFNIPFKKTHNIKKKIKIRNTKNIDINRMIEDIANS